MATSEDTGNFEASVIDDFANTIVVFEVSIISFWFLELYIDVFGFSATGPKFPNFWSSGYFAKEETISDTLA